MNYRPSPLYRQDFPPDIDQQIARAINSGCAGGADTIYVLFRADDIGIPSRAFEDLIEIFRRRDLPLCLATVPSWITPDRFAQLTAVTGTDPTRWCWHQHGRLHRNFEQAGKKQEFGPARDYHTLKTHLEKGKQRLTDILGERFEPFFTPPWNRCSMDTIKALEELGYKGISRSAGAQPETVATLPDIQVNVDLHTKKTASAEEELASILGELEQALQTGYAGVMLHHQRMNARSYRFLDILVEKLQSAPRIRFVNFEDMINSRK